MRVNYDMGDKSVDEENVVTVPSDSVIEYSDDLDDEAEQSDTMHSDVPLTEEEVEDLISDFLEVESKAADAQESLEDESLARVEIDVKEELSQTLQGDDLETAVADEMLTFKEECEAILDELETKTAYLLEQLDGAGVELPRLYKLIETQAPNGCSTEAWRKRTQWVGSQVTSDINENIINAEKFLQTQRPVRRQHGKLLEEGASGYLAKKFATADNSEAVNKSLEVDWSSFNKVVRDGTLFGSKQWSSVYLASTPQQAAELGLQFSGVDEVEEIGDVDDNCSYPFVAAAMANEGELNLSAQIKNFRKVKEEDDADGHRKLQLRLKQRRHKKKMKMVCQKEVLIDIDPPDLENGALSQFEMEEAICNDTASVVCESGIPDISVSTELNRFHDSDDLKNIRTKRCRTIVIDSDDVSIECEDNRASPFCDVTKMGSQYLGENHGSSVNSDNLSSQCPTGSFFCTVCNEVAVEVHKHPCLDVVVCKECKCLLEFKLQKKDPAYSECYCAWCGMSTDLISCKSCITLFCTRCIQRNIGESCPMGVLSFTWQCCCCSPRILQRLTLELERAGKSGVLVVSSSDSDSDSSDDDVNVLSSFKKKHKKKIRRILDDTELGEETKRKIAIEKERQNRLKSMMKGTANHCGVSLEGAGIEVLGDASTGYIVNVVREKGEEAVRIPPSISAKLKAHQIAGIRFIWENIIQSIRKVKSGDKGLGCILAHTMGLGKTFQVIAFLYAAMRSVDLGLKSALIVTPVNVLHNWRQEFNKWRPVEFKPLRVFMLEDVSRERRPRLLAKWRVKGGVFLIGYAAFRNLSFGKNVKDWHMAKEICYNLQEGPDILVCDEAHMIKNTKSDTTQALKLVKCQRRIALTGSPLQNNLMEYYCMVDFVREGFLGSSYEFRNRFQNPIENGQHTNSTSVDVKIMNQRSHILYEELKGFVQRMDMNVVKKDLPPKTVFVIAVKLSPLQRKLYKRFLDVHGFTSEKNSNENFQKRGFFAGYQALAQIWNHPGILQLTKLDKDLLRREDSLENFIVDDSTTDDNVDYSSVHGDKLKNKNDLMSKRCDENFFHQDWWNDLLQKNNYKEAEYSGKMVLLLDILTFCRDVGDKALVFSQSIPTLDLIEFYLPKLTRQSMQRKYWKKGKDWYRLDGRTAASERQKLVELFNEPTNKRVKCTLISTKAGCLGINLHAANRVIIVDGSWNPTHDLQAIYRAWRYGQKKPVFAYRLMAHGTMEEKIYKRQVTKEGLAARVVDRQQVHRTMSKEEMLHLFDFGDDENSANTEEESNPIVCGLKENSERHNGCVPSDKLMEILLGRHHPRWIANYHEHESLLQENEEEKLSKEEQDMAWEVYRKCLEWEEVHNKGGPLNEQQKHQQQQQDDCSTGGVGERTNKGVIIRNLKASSRKCTNLAHLLTLRSQGTKPGCSTVCGECAQEISWVDLK